MALLELFATATRARVIASDVLQGVPYRLLGTMLTVRTMNVPVLMMMVVVMLAVRAVNVGLVHTVLSVVMMTPLSALPAKREALLTG